MARKKKYTKDQVLNVYGVRSGLEAHIIAQLESCEVEYEYEQLKIKFTQPEKKRTYTPDFVITTCYQHKIIIESKGRFLTADRQKHLFVKEQHPELDIRFVFTNSKSKIAPSSKTTYGDWCDKNGFIYADKRIPTEWFSDKGKR